MSQSAVEGFDLDYHRNELSFRGDSRYEQSFQGVEQENLQDSRGRLSLTTGDYTISGNRLRRFDVQPYGLDNGHPYLYREDLVPGSRREPLPEVVLLLTRDQDVLTIDYLPGSIRPDLAYCVEFETYCRA